MKPEERPTPESSANAFVATKEFMPSKGVLVVPIETAQRLERERDRLLEALIGVLEEWEGGYRPEDCGTTMAIAREAIAEVEGSR